MRPERQVQQSDVWGHWQRVEQHASPDFRTPIRDELPANLAWFSCIVEPQDCDRFYIVSSRDWLDISGGTFQPADVLSRLDLPTNNKDTIRIANDICRKISHLDSGGQLDTQLVVITDSASLSGPFTLIEGNRCCVAFLRQGSQIGITIFVGCSPQVVDCVWTRQTYRHFNLAQLGT